MNKELPTSTLDGISRGDFRAIAHNLPVAITEVDLNLRIVYMNQTAMDILGLDDQDLSKEYFVKDLVSPQQYGTVVEGLKRLSDGVPPRPMGLLVQRKDGVEVSTETNAHLLKQNGDPVGYIIFSTDMTRRNAVDEKLKAQEGLYRIILDHSKFLGILIVDDKFTIEYTNDMLCEIVGRTRSEMLGSDFRTLLHPDSVDLVAERYVRRQRDEDVPSVYTCKALRKDGAIRELKLSSSTMKSEGGSIKTVAQVLDITDDLAHRVALKESEHRYRTLVETMDSGLCVDDENGVCIFANQALCDMIGYGSPEEIIGKSTSLWVEGWTEEIIHEKTQMRKKGEHEHYEVNLIHKSRELVPTIIHASPYLSAKGEYLGSFAVFTNVSELKRAEAESRFLLDLLLHDIGNQLQLILAGADFLSNDSSPKEIENARKYVLDGASRCLELITNVRRAEESKVEALVRTDLAYVIRTQIRLFSGQYNIKPIVEGIPDEVIVRANAALGHLFWNLMENAIKHNPKKDKRLWITGEKRSKTFTLEFADNGPGLDRKNKSRLFDPTRRSTGVGIHLVRRLASKYGARLSVGDRVSGEPEKGLEVRITFDIME